MHTHISGLDRRGHRRDRPLHPAVCWASGSDQLALGVAGLRRLEDATDSVAGGAVDPSCDGCRCGHALLCRSRAYTAVQRLRPLRALFRPPVAVPVVNRLDGQAHAVQCLERQPATNNNT